MDVYGLKVRINGSAYDNQQELHVSILLVNCNWFMSEHNTGYVVPRPVLSSVFLTPRIDRPLSEHSPRISVLNLPQYLNHLSICPRCEVILSGDTLSSSMRPG